MLTKFLSSISELICQKNCIDDEYKKQQIEYALTALVIFFLNSVNYLILSIISGRFFESLIMLACFLVFRTYNKGYHAKTPLKCYLLGIIFWIFGMILSSIISSSFVYILIYLLSLSLFFLINTNPNNGTFKREDFRIIVFLYSINTTIILVLFAVQSNHFTYAATGSYLSILAIILNSRLANESEQF